MPLSSARPLPLSSNTAAVNAAPHTPKRPSTAAQSGTCGDDILYRVPSYHSSSLSAARSGVSSPRGVLQPQNVVAQLTEVAQGRNVLGLKLFEVLRRTLQQSIVFELFEDDLVVRNAMVERLRALPIGELCTIVRQYHKVLVWRQEGLGSAKVAQSSTPLELLGLVTFATTLLGQEQAAFACLVAKNHISAGQQVEKRYTVLLLAIASLLPGPQGPGDIEPLRGHCKAILEQMKDNNPKKQRARREQLLKKVGRYLTQKRSDKLPLVALGLSVPPPFVEPDPSVGRSEDRFVHIEAQDCQEPQSPRGAAAYGALPQEPVDKAALTRRWLAKLWPAP